MEKFFERKKVLVAGGSGFIGTNLTKKLAELGASVRSTYFMHEPREKQSSVEYIYANLLDPNDCFKVTESVDIVVMAAAKSSGAAVIEKTPLVHLTPNLIMNSQMLAASYENKVKNFCFISSNTVYPVTESPVSEDDSSYDFFEKYYIVGWMKKFSEIMCDMYSNHIDIPMQTTIVRPGNLYGPFDKFNKAESKVIAALIRRAIEEENPFIVWGDGYDVKDFLFIDDFVEGLLLAISEMSDSQPINIASGNPITIREVLDVILSKTNCAVNNVNYDTSKPTMIPKRLINIDKIVAATGWSPKVSIEVGIEKTINWYKEYYADKTPEEVES
jgi:GDP-L-fucose synthase